jgi:LmbE family N-acetylglucosaminyl deacetylase
VSGWPLPVPDGSGIYSIPDDLLCALEARQEHLAGLGLELVAPLNGSRYSVAKRRPSGRPVLAVEPHHDDLILSAGGHFLTQARPLTVVTVFTRSTSVHPSVDLTSLEVISTLRAEESREAFRPLLARQHLLGLKDADAPYQPHDTATVEHVVEQLRPHLEEQPDAELIAPASVTRHPDHMLVHEAACRLGCTWFWDDTSFYPTYAANVDDRLLFEQRTDGSLVCEVVDITDVVLDKLALLHMYQSQMQPREMYRVLRYNWTVAATLRGGASAGHARYGERFFRTVLPGQP